MNNLSEPYEIEDSIKDVSEKELSQLNKSHPDDKVVENPKIIRPPRPIGGNLIKNKGNGGVHYRSMDTGIDMKPKQVKHFQGNRPILPPKDETDVLQDNDNDSLQEKINENYGEDYNLYDADPRQFSSMDKDRAYSSARKRNSGRKQYSVTFKTNPSPTRFDEDDPQLGEFQEEINQQARMLQDFDSKPSQQRSFKPPKRKAQRLEGKAQSPNFTNLDSQYTNHETEEPFGETDLIDKDLRVRQKVLKPIVPRNLEDNENPRPRLRNHASPTPASRNPSHDNPTMYDKLASKIRQQAKRIIELEAQLSESRQNDSKHASIVARNSSTHFREEALVVRKKNDLLMQENEVLREKIDILQKSLEQKKDLLMAQSYNEDPNMNERDFYERSRMIAKISDLETEKIELEEVLKKEVIKNEKLESMVELLKKINEEKLENAGFVPYQGKSRVDTVIDAAHVFENNQDLQNENHEKNQEITTQLREIESLKQLIQSLNMKNEQLVKFKTISDQKFLRQKKQELQYSKALDKLKEQASLVNIQYSAEKRRKETLKEQLSSCREAMGIFVDSTDGVSEVMNFLANDLLL